MESSGKRITTRLLTREDADKGQAQTKLEEWECSKTARSAGRKSGPTSRACRYSALRSLFIDSIANGNLLFLRSLFCSSHFPLFLVPLTSSFSLLWICANPSKKVLCFPSVPSSFARRNRALQFLAQALFKVLESSKFERTLRFLSVSLSAPLSLVASIFLIENKILAASTGRFCETREFWLSLSHHRLLVNISYIDRLTLRKPNGSFQRSAYNSNALRAFFSGFLFESSLFETFLWIFPLSLLFFGSLCVFFWNLLRFIAVVSFSSVSLWKS